MRDFVINCQFLKYKFRLSKANRMVTRPDLNEVAARNFRRPPGHSIDRRREVFVEGPQSGPGQTVGHRQCQRHHRSRLRRQQDFHFPGFRTCRWSFLREHAPSDASRDLQSGEGYLRVQ